MTMTRFLDELRNIIRYICEYPDEECDSWNHMYSRIIADKQI